MPSGSNFYLTVRRKCFNRVKPVKQYRIQEFDFTIYVSFSVVNFRFKNSCNVSNINIANPSFFANFSTCYVLKLKYTNASV